MQRPCQVVCTYHGFRRELCPIILGCTDGVEKALTFQFGGGGSKPLPRGGSWRCLVLADVTDIELRDGPWHTGSARSTAQSCVAEVHYDTNPDSPYHPQRRIHRLIRP